MSGGDEGAQAAAGKSAVEEAIEQARRRALIGSAFTPASPVTNQDLFAGRVEQLARLLSLAELSGKHAIIYGDRGVGKTSLARVAHMLLSVHYMPMYYTCSSLETFSAIWHGVLSETNLSLTERRMGFSSNEYNESVASAAALLQDHNGDLTPNQLRKALEVLADIRPVVVFIDEFDRISDKRTRNQFADTIKLLADQGVKVTLVLLGVGDTVEDLVHEHESISRNLTQIPMPRMNDDEIRLIVVRGMAAAELDVSDSFTDQVVALSQGLPHYTHLLCQHAALTAAQDGMSKVEGDHFGSAIAAALNDVSATVRDKYYRAITSNRETIHREVLLACARAPKDELGTFAPADVRDELRNLTGKTYAFAAFAAHLRDFSGVGARGGVLQRRGDKRPRYKFLDPLLPPYVLMRQRLDTLTVAKP